MAGEFPTGAIRNRGKVPGMPRPRSTAGPTSRWASPSAGRTRGGVRRPTRFLSPPAGCFPRRRRPRRGRPGGPRGAPTAGKGSPSGESGFHTPIPRSRWSGTTLQTGSVRLRARHFPAGSGRPRPRCRRASRAVSGPPAADRTKDPLDPPQSCQAAGAFPGDQRLQGGASAKFRFTAGTDPAGYQWRDRRNPPFSLRINEVPVTSGRQGTDAASGGTERKST